MNRGTAQTARDLTAPLAHLTIYRLRNLKDAIDEFAAARPRWPLETPPPVAGSNSPRRTGRSVLLTCFRFARKFLRSFLQSIAFAFEFQLVVAMHEAVQDGSGHDVVAEVGGPVLDDAV